MLLAACAMMCGFFSPAFADERQYKIEAAYLYSFFNYITWPGYAEPQQLQKPLVCVYGNDPILPYLDYVRTKMSGERTIEIRLVNDEGSVTGCKLLFIRHRLNYHMLSTLAKDTLVVFKPDDPLDRGGMIELSEDGQRIAIKINQEQLEKNDFHVSSRLLDLAQTAR